MNAALRRHYEAIQQLARDEWPPDGPLATHPASRPTLGDDVFTQVGAIHTTPDGTIERDEERAATYAATLARIRQEQPDTFTALKTILDEFHPPSSGDAFFPGGADDDLAPALRDAGWELRFYGAGYVYRAKHPATAAKLHYIEGDLYDRTRVQR